MAVNTHTVLIKVKQMGARKVSRQMRGLVVGLTSVGLAAVGMAREIIRASDEMTNLGNKSRVFARDQGEAANRMATVVSVARTMNMEMSGVADVMQRVSMSADQVGLSNEQVTTMVANLAKATKLSGATAQEATGALRQFGQALAANRLSGQELNSVLEQTPMIARIIADSMGVAVGELRALGKEGKITATVMKDALGGTIDDLDEKFAKFKFPIADQFVSLKRETTILVDNLSKLSGAGETLGEAISKLVEKITELNRSFATGGPQAQEFLGQLDKAKSVVTTLGTAWAGSKIVKGVFALGKATKNVAPIANIMAKIPHPVGKIAAAAVLAAGGVTALWKATSNTEKKAFKPLRSELENASMALADISNKNEDAIKFWKKHYDMVGKTTEALKEFAEAQITATESVKLGDMTVMRGGFGSMDEAIDASYEAQKRNLTTGIAGIRAGAIASGNVTRSGDLFKDEREGVERLERELAALEAAYDALVAKRRGINDLAGAMEDLTKTAITDFRSEYDANWPVQSLMDDLTAIGSTYRDVVNQTGGLTQEQLAEMRRLYQGVGNELIGLIPEAKEFNEVTGDLDTSSFAYQNLMKLLEGTGLELSDLTEFTKRFKDAQDDANDALEDANDLLDDKQQLYKKLESNMDPVVALQNEYNRRLKEAKELLGENTTEFQKYLDMLKEWEKREKIDLFATGAGKTGDPLAQAAAEAAQFPQQETEAKSGIDGLVSMGLMTEEQGQNAIDNMKRRHEMNQQLLKDQSAMETMNNSLLEGELTGAELREGAFASMREGFASVAGPALDLGANIASITAAGVGGLTNAITEMATTGKANFKELGLSFLRMITQMIVQMTVMMALLMVMETISPGSSKLLGLGGRAAGGPVTGGNAYVVGERGPELFVPPQSGSIKSNKQAAGMMQQQPQVTIVNVDSAENTLNAMGSEEGEGIIMNVIQRNPELLRSIG